MHREKAERILTGFTLFLQGGVSRRTATRKFIQHDCQRLHLHRLSLVTLHYQSDSRVDQSDKRDIVKWLSNTILLWQTSKAVLYIVNKAYKAYRNLMNILIIFYIMYTHIYLYI